MSGSNLPPGVTQGMIDRYFAGPCEECIDGKHEECSDDDCSCNECDDRARDDAAEVAYEAWKDARYEQDEPDFDYGPDD